jgi:hypothetical protein
MDKKEELKAILEAMSEKKADTLKVLPFIEYGEEDLKRWGHGWDNAVAWLQEVWDKVNETETASQD